MSEASFEGFYVAYLAGITGTSMAMLVMRSGYICGADLGGVRYDGSYAPTEYGQALRIEVSIPPNIPLLLGRRSQANAESYQLNFELPADFSSRPYIRVETRDGPVNARFVKIRGFDD